MPRLFNEIAFHPSINELIPRAPEGRLVIFTGGNNSGKSAYLKKTIEDPTKLYVGVNRFYSFHHLGLYSDNRNEINQWFQQMQQNAATQQFQNFEQSFFNCSSAISRLSNERRSVLFKTFEELFGSRVEVLAEDPNNDFSNRYISIDGDSLSITSSGTRLFLGVLSALMDDRFTTVAIDEPELGLSPSLQRKLADIIVRGEKKAELFPHNPNIVLSTHSHLFLDRDRPENNYIVEKSGNLITSRPCRGFHELHDIQFRLLGNDLSQLFLPDAVAFVEGETDKLYIERLCSLHVPHLRVIVQACGGDIAKRLTYWSDSLGDMQLSPYRNRTLVIYDSVKQAGIERAIVGAGLPPESRIEWRGNGIEYVYPDALLAEIYRRAELTSDQLVIDGDTVSVGDISYKKMELCRKVLEMTNVATPVHPEVEQKLLSKLRALTPPN